MTEKHYRHDKRVRVLRVIGRLNMGGPAHQAALLSGRRFFPGRYQSVLAHGRVPPGEGSLAHLAGEEGANEILVSSLVQPVSPLADALALRRLVGIIRAFRPHVIHTHTAKAGFVGRQAALVAGRPRPVLIHTFHGHVLDGYFGWPKSHLYRRLERRLAARTDLLIGVSNATVDALVRLGVAPRDKFRVVRLGLDLGRFASLGGQDRARARAELGYSNEDIVCAFVGRFAPIKRVDLLLAAFARARAHEPRLKLLMVGDGGARSGFERLADGTGYGEAIHFAGYRGDMERVWAGADLALLSSDSEGTPVALIEAAAAGLPSVATDVGGVAETVSSTGSLLVPPGSSHGLAAAIAELAADPARRREMGQAAQAEALARFEVERLIGDIDGIYSEFLAGRPGAGG